MCHADQHWTEALPLVLLGIRTAFKEDLQASVAELVYGEPLRIPGELLTPTAEPVDPAHLITQLRQYMARLRPIPATRHASPATFVHSDLEKCTHVFLRQGTTRRAYSHYIGSTTGEKKSGAIYQIPFSGRPLQAAQRLLQLSSWLVDPRSNLRVYLEQAASSRTNIPIHILKTATSTITGGSVVHRLDDHVTKRGTLNNIRPNVTSHIYFSTDRMGRFNRGSDNYNMHFQGAIHFGMAIFGLCSFRNLDHIDGLVLTYKGSCCEEKLLDFLIRNDNIPPTISKVSNNPLLFADMKEIGKSVHPRRSSIATHTTTLTVSMLSYILFWRGSWHPQQLWF
ncbi:hypothetical protein B7P43_G14066 [Cryptotermes secundus]|uniref:Mononegavirales mRNA-capping domain-containing protein n=1 Tax=Cryptotermes secundus TaxID=105785 RepID=A0A2J7RSC2_9NEOP|nr:hypothetical protein B7P43_G14066 [Cryptotermes secundus]